MEAGLSVAVRLSLLLVEARRGAYRLSSSPISCIFLSCRCGHTPFLILSRSAFDVRRLSVFTTHRPSLDPSQHSLEPPRPSLLSRLRALFHKPDELPSSAKSSPTLAGAVRVKVETDVAHPHAGESASPRLGEYSTVQWGVPGGGAPRRPSVAVGPLEGRPFAQLDPVGRRRESEREKDVELAHELQYGGEIEQIEEQQETELEQGVRPREPA